jgi:hypothetical protein
VKELMAQRSRNDNTNAHALVPAGTIFCMWCILIGFHARSTSAFRVLVIDAPHLTLPTISPLASVFHLVRK